MQSMFGTEALPLRYWFVTLVIGVAMFLVVEIEKRLTRRFRKTPEQSRAPRCRRALLSQGSSMIKTFRFALLACGLVGGALTATAAPAVPVRVATVELAPHAEERAIPGRVEAIRAVDIRARTEGGDCSAPLPGRAVCYRRRPAVYLDDAQPRARGWRRPS